MGVGCRTSNESVKHVDRFRRNPSVSFSVFRINMAEITVFDSLSSTCRSKGDFFSIVQIYLVALKLYMILCCKCILTLYFLYVVCRFSFYIIILMHHLLSYVYHTSVVFVMSAIIDSYFSTKNDILL